MTRDLLESGEDYLEACLYIEKTKGTVKSVDVARFLGVTRPSACRALGNLSDNGYIEKDSYTAIKITQKGRIKAHEIISKHTALTALLTTVLKVNPVTAEHDACKMEHCLSDETTKKLFDFLKTYKK